MRSTLPAWLLAIGMLPAALATSAAADPYTEALFNAERAARHAELELQLYRPVEFARQVRQLDAQIELAELEIDIQRRRLHEYAPMDRFYTGRALGVSIDEARLCLAEARSRLADLEAERAALTRYRGAHYRLRLLDVRQTQARLAELMGEEVAVVAPGP